MQRELKKQVRVKQNWTGDNKSAFRMLGASNHAIGDREQHDYYATDPKAIPILFNEETFTNVWECACGEGWLSNEIQKYGVLKRSSDLVNRGYGEVGVDFLSIDNMSWDGDIITNPPYRYAQEFVEKALQIIPTGNKVAMFLKLQFMEGQKRKVMFKNYPPKTIYVSSSRIKCYKNGNNDYKNSAIAYAWYVWEKGYKSETKVKWVN